MADPKQVQVGGKVRWNYGRIPEVLEMPNMIAIQKQSYGWFLNEGLRETFVMFPRFRISQVI